MIPTTGKPAPPHPAAQISTPKSQLSPGQRCWSILTVKNERQCDIMETTASRREGIEWLLETAMRSKRSMWKVIAAVAVLITASGLLVRYAALPKVRQRRVDSAIARFQSQPRQGNANTLFRLIDTQRVSAKQANRIMSVVLSPRVTTRESYRLGQKPAISVEQRLRVAFERTAVAREIRVLTEGQVHHVGSVQTYNRLSTRPQCFELDWMPRKPGTYRIELRCKYSLTPYQVSTSWSRPKWGLAFPWNLLPRRVTRSTWPGALVEPEYECEFVTPVEVVVAEKGKAEEVAFRSGPILDTMVRGGFDAKPSRAERSYWSAAGNRLCTGGITVHSFSLRAAIAFRCVFQFPDGREVSQKSEHSEPICFRANRVCLFSIDGADFMLEEPGEYSGTIVLRPDLEAAYKDPGIKSIWKGELRFPISFTIWAPE
jgi:hypothetical protein